MKLKKVISGGQTGVDQASLRAAKACGIETGGWSPKAWKTESGLAPWLSGFGLMMHAGDYAARTRANVSDSDATLILYVGKLTGGTRLTRECAAAFHKPFLAIDLDGIDGILDAAGWAKTIDEWLDLNNLRTLNVAGPRESKHPGIGAKAEAFLVEVFRCLKEAS